jgi:ATP-binding cassette subfamily B protein
MTLPNGYETIFDDQTSISSGERQLLTIARAIAQNNKLVILDEATSNVDTQTEIKIQNAMDKVTKGRTSFIIAHRLSTIKNANIILVMDKGEIVEKGTHKQLLSKKGVYASLYNSQFSEEN